MGAVGKTETELRLRVGMQNKKSTITERYFTSPLKLGTPHTTADRLHIVLMMASAGVLKGDRFSYDIKCDAGTKSKLTEQSYTKIFDTGTEGAARKQHITLNGSASLYYRPSAVIPFQNSTFDGETDVYLDETMDQMISSANFLNGIKHIWICKIKKNINLFALAYRKPAREFVSVFLQILLRISRSFLMS